MSSDSDSGAEEAAMVPACAGGSSERPAEKTGRKRKAPGAVLSTLEKLFWQKVGVRPTKPPLRKQPRANKVPKLSRASFLPSDPSESSGTDEEDASVQGKRPGPNSDAKEGGDSVIAIEDGEGMFNPEGLAHQPMSHWTPSPRVAKYLSARLRKPLDNDLRQRLKRECPRPTVEGRVATTPDLDPAIPSLAESTKDFYKGLERAWKTCQGKLLDVAGPLAKILEMAETAKEAGELLDPTALSGLAQRAICLLGNANCALSVERRKSVLIKLDPKWTTLSLVEPGPLANGLLFGDSFLQELKKLISSVNAAGKEERSLSNTYPYHAYDRAGRNRGRWPSRGYHHDSERGQYKKYEESEPSSYSKFYPARGRGSGARPYRGRRRAGKFAGFHPEERF
ncbi:uncharacterized protein LOC144826049 [Lissotriton helveticus]